MADKTPEQRRRHFRLYYPENDRPSVIVDGVKYYVINVSEGGVLLSLVGAERVKKIDREKELVEGRFVTADADFNGRAQLKVAGYVLRVIDNAFVIRLVESIPLSVMMQEQRYVIRRTKKPDDEI